MCPVLFSKNRETCEVRENKSDYSQVALGLGDCLLWFGPWRLSFVVSSAGVRFELIGLARGGLG